MLIDVLLSSSLLPDLPIVLSVTLLSIVSFVVAL